MRQVLINLLGNAAKFTPAGGTITVTAAPAPHAPGELRISVSNTGCGIPPEEHERVFEHLYQREVDLELARKGLGLYICRQIVTQHGGRIRVAAECLLPDRDLLLPRIFCDQHGEMAFIVVAADAAGAAVLVDRLRRQLESAGDTGAGRLEFRLDAALLPVARSRDRTTGERLDEIAAVLAAELERMTVAFGRLLPR